MRGRGQSTRIATNKQKFSIERKDQIGLEGRWRESWFTITRDGDSAGRIAPEPMRDHVPKKL